MSDKVLQLLQKAETLKSSRLNFETEWQNVSEIFRPTKANVTVSRTPGEKEHIRRLYESFPITAVSTLKSIIIGVFFNRSIKPIALSSGVEEINEDPEVAEWLTDFSDMMLKQMFDPKSCFEQALSEAVQDDIVFGTIATQIEEGSSHPVKYYSLPIENFCIAESKEGDVDYVVLMVKKTARQIMQEWGGRVSLDESIIVAAKEQPFKEFPLQLHILPREERDFDKIDISNKPIAGYWIDQTNKVILEELGWDSMPIAVGRAEKATGEIYGTSRAMMALADARQLNDMSKQINEITEIAAKPPLNVNADFNKRINLTAGALNYPDQKSLRSGAPALEQIITTGSIPLNYELLDRKEQRIRETFFLDKLKIFDDPNATATQVIELRAESFRIMGDFITGLISYMDKVLNATFDILFRRVYDLNNNLVQGNGLFDKEIPTLLRNNPSLKVEYINPIAQSQKITESQAIDKWLTDVINLAQVNQDVLDLINFDEVIRKKRQILNIDPELIMSKGRVSQIRGARQEQQESQENMMETQALAETAAKAKQGGLI